MSTGSGATPGGFASNRSQWRTDAYDLAELYKACSTYPADPLEPAKADKNAAVLMAQEAHEGGEADFGGIDDLVDRVGVELVVKDVGWHPVQLPMMCWHDAPALLRETE